MLTVPHPVPLHDIVAIVHHLIVDSLAMTANFILIAAIIVASPPFLKSYKLILLSSALVDVFAGMTQLATMSRIVPATPIVAHFYVGPCTIVSGRFCHVLDTIMLATVFQTLLLIVVSFCYRIYILHRAPPSTARTISICFASFIPNAIFVLVFSTSQDDSRLVVEALRIVRPNYSVDSYVVEGFLDVFSPFAMLLIGSVCVPVIPAFLFIIALRRKFIRSISLKSETMSDRTKAMHLALCKVLYLQSSLPLCYVFPVIFMFQCVFSDSFCSSTIEHGMFETASYIALMAPLISLFYIKNYRMFAYSLVRRCAFKDTTKQPFTLSTSVVPSRVIRDCSPPGRPLSVFSRASVARD